MKKAYNKSWVENLHILHIADEWCSNKHLSKEQKIAVEAAFPHQFYNPGIFVKIGLFIFTLIACSFSSGFLSLFLLGNVTRLSFSIVSLVCMVGFIFFLEYLIKYRKLYHSGIDNALLYAAIGAAVAPFSTFFNNLQVWQYCVMLFSFSFIATLRYADWLTTGISVFALFCLLGNTLIQFPIGKAIIPFAVMILAATMYFLVRRNKDIYYYKCQKLTEVLALVIFYLGGNYLVVREGNALLNDLTLPSAPQIAFAPVFYIFTCTIPGIYLFFGLKNKDRILLIIGLLAFAFSCYTYRHYFGVLTSAQELALAGMFMIALSVSLIKYLHIPRHGISDEQEGKRKLANLEALIAAQHLGQTPQQADNVEFGGGNFGGGGSGEAY